jgi:hypothetical protein
MNHKFHRIARIIKKLIPTLCVGTFNNLLMATTQNINSDVIPSATTDPARQKGIFAVACASCIDEGKDACGMTQ